MFSTCTELAGELCLGVGGIHLLNSSAVCLSLSNPQALEGTTSSSLVSLLPPQNPQPRITLFLPPPQSPAVTAWAPTLRVYGGCWPWSRTNQCQNNGKKSNSPIFATITLHWSSPPAFPPSPFSYSSCTGKEWLPYSVWLNVVRLLHKQLCLNVTEGGKPTLRNVHSPL